MGIDTKTCTTSPTSTKSAPFYGSSLKFQLLILLLIAPIVKMALAPESASIIESNALFHTQFYNQLAARPGNFFFSPLSLHTVLSMIYQGAKTTTAAKLAQVLGLPSRELAATGYLPLIQRINNMDNITLELANKVFLMEGKEMNAMFEKVLKSSFLSDVGTLNFEKNVESAKTINDWVLKQTHEKIKDLIQADDLNELTRMVLVNAIYFKGIWGNKFLPEQTTEEDFFLTEDDTVKVRMMHAKHRYNFVDNMILKCRIIELPYTNKNISMVVMLPHRIDGIKDLEARLATLNFTDLITNLTLMEVELSLPKFKIENTLDLQHILTDMDLGEIFDEKKADFSEIIANEKVFVSKAIQKSFIEVNEEGAEAAVATGMVMTMRYSMPIPVSPVEFKADHPFMFYLIENKHNILFSGRISKPQE